MNRTSPQRLGCSSGSDFASRWSWLCPVTRRVVLSDKDHSTPRTIPGLTDLIALSSEQRAADTADILQIGRYRITDLLGKGGQATTYKAWDPDLKRHVVLKRYHDAESPEVRKRR